MPTPGPPLREREGMMRRGRAAALAPPVLEPEAEGAGGADAEGPACEAAGSVLEEGPPPLLLTLAAAAVAACPAVGVVEFAGAAAVVTATTAGSADDADARLGILPRRRRHKNFFFGGGGECGEKRGAWMRLGVVAAVCGSATSPVMVLALRRPDDGERLELFLSSLLSSPQSFGIKITVHPIREAKVV
jgi:hypothetical protein